MIQPLRCNRPEKVAEYVALLRERKKALPISLIRQQHGSRYRYRIFDGAHRFRAANRRDAERHVHGDG